MVVKMMQPPTNCSPRKPHFFKVLVRDFKKRLRIPPKFMKHIAKEASQNVILQGPNGSNWRAELSKTVNGNFLSAGWSNFVKDHALKEYEFLVFRYNGNMHFNVMIFDTTACEREDVFEMKTPKQNACEGNDVFEMKNSNKSGRKEKNRCGRPAKCSLDFNRILQHESIRNKLLKPLSDKKRASKQLKGQQISPKPTRHFNINPEDEEFQFRATGCQTIYVSKRRPVTAEERSKAQEAANSFHSGFPYIILCMAKAYLYKRYMLRFPCTFSRTHLPTKKSNMILRDPSGKGWVVAYFPGPGKGYFSGGWSAFACANNLEEGDFCAFERIAEVELRVHIFRVVEETTPLARITVKGF